MRWQVPQLFLFHDDSTRKVSDTYVSLNVIAQKSVTSRGGA